MNNGQVSLISVPSAVQAAALEPTVATAIMQDGGKQNGGDFDGMLSVIQLAAKEKGGQSGQLPPLADEVKIDTDTLAAGAAIDLFALLQVSPQIIQVAESAASKTSDSGKADESRDTVPPGIEPADAALLTAMAAYSHPGRIPEVNISTQLPVGRLQNATAAADQPVVNAAPPVDKQSEQVSAGETPAAADKIGAALSKQPVEGQNPLSQQEAIRTAIVNVQPTTLMAEPALFSVGRLQNVATTTAQAVVISAPAADKKTEQIAAGETPAATEKRAAVPAEQPVAGQNSLPQPETVQANAADVDRKTAPAVAALIPLPVGRLQNVPAATDQPVVITVPSAAKQPVATTAGAPADQVSAAAQTPEVELEIQLSQPRPITARLTVSAVAQQASAPLQKLAEGQQTEKGQTGKEQSAAKEMAPSLRIAASAAEPKLGSDASLNSGNNQGQPDVSPDSEMLAQQLRGQLSTEHQKVAVLAAKAVPTEPTPQDIPGQVLQQVKDRLLQHDVKPGNQQITLTLSPDTLGELKMNLNLQGQKLSVEIITENRTVRDAIVLHTDALKESLARQNITMESFDVTTGGKGSGNQGQNQNAWRELAKQQNQQQLWASPRGYQTAQADLPSSQLYQRQQGETMLDIHY